MAFRKWQFDPAATKAARKAADSIERAIERIKEADARTWWDATWSLSPEAEGAVALMRAAGKRVWDEHDAAQARAKALDK
jgi:hypothetical protein